MSEKQIIVQLNPDVPPTGSDLGVVNAARRSFGKRSEWEYCGGGYCNDQCNDPDGAKGKCPKLKDKDKRLLEFLARGMTADDFEAFVSSCIADGYMVEDQADWECYHQALVEKLWQWRNTPTHDTPFNHGFFSFEVKAPIFVRAQLVKHEYLIMSEFSRRYITDDLEFYTPDEWRKAAENKKQGSSDETVEGIWDLEVKTGAVDMGDEYDPTIRGITTCTMNFMEAQIEFYRQLIREGVAPEQARMVLPQSLMTAWTWSGTLGAFANMCKLRIHPEAQYESRLVAERIYEELKKQFPVAAPLLVEGVY